MLTSRADVCVKTEPPHTHTVHFVPVNGGFGDGNNDDADDVTL